MAYHYKQTVCRAAETQQINANEQGNKGGKQAVVHRQGWQG